MKYRRTNVHFDFGGCYSEEHKWISKNFLYAISIKTSSLEEISYTVLAEKICRKIAIDETTVKLKLSYNLSNARRESYIVDDEDVIVYLTSLNKEGLTPVLHVELLNDVEDNMRFDQLSRAEGGSSFGVNYKRVDDGVEDVANVGILTIFRAGGTAEEQNEPVIDEVRANVEEENVGNDDSENVTRGGFAYVDSPMINHLDDSLPENVDLPRAHVEEIQYIEEWDDGTGLELKQEFCSREALQDLVRRAANKNCFGYETIKSDRTRLMLRCREASKGCQWYLRATRTTNSLLWSVRIHRKMHTCSRSDASTSSSKPKGSQRLVANLLHESYPGRMDTPPPKSILGLVQKNLSLECSYSTALRGKKRHVCVVRGSPEKSYKLLFSYLYELEKANHGTVTYVELDLMSRFKYLFIALGASIEGFRAMRKVIVVDATFLTHGGVLVFATAQDPNHHHYPISFGVLDGENHLSWNWFFTKLKTVIPNVPELVFISDRHLSIIAAVDTVYPGAKHAHCIWHLSQNVRQRVSFDKDAAAEKFRACAHAYTESKFNIEYNDFKNRFPAAATYLEAGITVEKWTRCYFQGDKYNVDTSNSAESINSVFKKARTYPLLPMIDAIIEKMSEWFNKQRHQVAAASDFKKVVPYVENELHERCATAITLMVTELNGSRLEYDVKGVNGKSYVVDLEMKTCSCRCFDIDKYPCVHAIAAARSVMRKEGRKANIQIYDLCSKYYFVETWALAYVRTIYLVPHESHWNVPAEIEEMLALPPEKRPKKGRNQETRFPSTGERRRKRNNKFVSGINLERWFQSENS